MPLQSVCSHSQLSVLCAMCHLYLKLNILSGYTFKLPHNNHQHAVHLVQAHAVTNTDLAYSVHIIVTNRTCDCIIT